jgi:hypothetical protein
MDQGSERRQACDLYRPSHAQRAADYLHGLQKSASAQVDAA